MAGTVTFTASMLPGGGASAQAVLDLCSGVRANLPVLAPVTNVTTGLIGGLLDPVLNGIVGNINTNLTSAISGQPITLSLLDQNGNLVSTPSPNCSVSASGVVVDNNVGISAGGGQISGLGGTGNPQATAGTVSAIALGNGASTSATSPNAVALGTGATASVASGVALGAGSVANRAAPNGAVEAFSQIPLRSTLGAVSVGAAGAERQITNVAGGTAPTDAVNLRQLSALGTGVTNLFGGGATIDASTGAITGPTYVVGGATYNNVGGAIGALDAGGLKYDRNADGTINYGSATLGNGTGTTTISNLAPGLVAAGSTQAVNGGQLYNLSQTSVQYDIDPATGLKTNTVTLAGGDPNTPVVIRNVGPGVLDTDAANVAQVRAAQTASANYTDLRSAQTLQQANAYTDQQIGNALTGMDSALGRLQQDVGAAKIEARQAAAVGLAAASLRYDDRPGKLSVAAGGAGWRGQAAAAFGVGYTAPDGWARFNVSAATSDNQWGVGGGLSLTLN